MLLTIWDVEVVVGLNGLPNLDCVGVGERQDGPVRADPCTRRLVPGRIYSPKPEFVTSDAFVRELTN